MNLRVGQHRQEGVDHADARAKHRNQTNNVAGLDACGGDERRGDCLGLQAQVQGGLVANERAQLADELAKLVRAGALVAQEAAKGSA